MIAAPIKLCIALLHNRNPNRYDYLRPLIDNLKLELSGDFCIETFEISNQPEMIQNKTSLTFLRKYILWKINREWTSYILVKQRNIFFDIAILIWQQFRTYTNKTLENQRSAIDSFVTDKHIKAWNHFLESDGDFLICFEDDVVFKRDSTVNLRKLLRGIKRYKEKPTYLNFAGGCSPEELRIEKLVRKRIAGCIFYRKPVTNTGCCYLINRPSAKIISLNLLKLPWLRLIPADWLINKIFMLTVPKYEYYCYHADPPIFEHGSVTGKYSSWLEGLTEKT